jgi:osmotically-inducible protein OsmY
MSRRIHNQLVNSSATSKTMKLTPRQLRRVQVKAANGQVTLSGAVETADQKREIESVVKEMPGVSSIKNDLAIKGADSKTDNLPSGPR